MGGSRGTGKSLAIFARASPPRLHLCAPWRQVRDRNVSESNGGKGRLKWVPAPGESTYSRLLRVVPQFPAPNEDGNSSHEWKDRHTYTHRRAIYNATPPMHVRAHGACWDGMCASPSPPTPKTKPAPTAHPIYLPLTQRMCVERPIFLFNCHFPPSAVVAVQPRLEYLRLIRTNVAVPPSLSDALYVTSIFFFVLPPLRDGPHPKRGGWCLCVGMYGSCATPSRGRVVEMLPRAHPPSGKKEKLSGTDVKEKAGSHEINGRQSFPTFVDGVLCAFLV